MSRQYVAALSTVDYRKVTKSVHVSHMSYVVATHLSISPRWATVWPTSFCDPNVFVANSTLCGSQGAIENSSCILNAVVDRVHIERKDVDGNEIDLINNSGVGAVHPGVPGVDVSVRLVCERRVVQTRASLPDEAHDGIRPFPIPASFLSPAFEAR